ncbi:MAG: VWA domain-containing protein, partial [Aquificota bacterium]|nr:VWA domain-containing protein [Aquificota bacterium]
EVIRDIKPSYPHHQLALSFVLSWIRRDVSFSEEVDRYSRSMERFVSEYLKEEDPQTSYDILMEDLWTRFRNLVDLSRDLNYVDLLLEEARGRNREDAHRGRIMTDVLGKLPATLRSAIRELKDLSADRVDPDLRKEIIKHLNNLPDWMRDYIRQMSYIDMLERDLRFLKHFLPRTLEVDVEHRGFLSFVFKPWEEERSVASSRSVEAEEKEDLSEKDRRFLKEHGLTEEEFRRYRLLIRSVLPYVDHFRRKFDSLLPQEEERWGGAYPRGKRLNFKRIPTEVPIRRGRIYSRKEVPERKELAFELLLDISSSMKKEDKIVNAVKSLLLFSEVLDKLRMPFSIRVFNENVYEVKGFEEDYRSARSKIMEIPSRAGGGTDLGKAVSVGLESLEVFTKKTGRKGIMILFTDGEPTRGIKGDDLKAYILQAKQKFPIVGVGVGEATRMVKEYFDRTGISVDDISKLPSALSFVIENQLRRLVSVG